MRLTVSRAICAAALPLLLCGGGIALADSIFVGTLERKDVKVESFRNGAIEFTVAGRAVEPVSADRISRLVLDDDKAFSSADQAFAEGKYGAAADSYQAILKASGRPWLKDWILPRQLQAANQAGRLELATSAFVQLAVRDLGSALRHRPSVREGMDARQLSVSAAELTKASTASGKNPAQQQAFLGLLLDVHRAQGDMASSTKVAEQLLKVIPSDLSDPAVARVQADVRLSIAKLALAKKDYAEAIKQIESGRQLFSDPAQQADAFYCLAQARDGQAGTVASKEALEDLAIDYMRAVAVARKTPEKRYVPESLTRVAEIQEKLGELKKAAALYAEVATDYKNSSVGANAVTQQQRLKEKTGM